MEAKSNKTLKRKKLRLSYEVRQKHWVGDGFYVHGLLRPSEDLIKHISPFILMDYASPYNFSKTNQRRGVGEHPHRGFETVTLAYQGGVEHRDSAGGGGIIHPGDVQWMTAGSGIVHDEFHSEQLSKEGGTFEMVQLWVNLPAKYKMIKPKYQGIETKNIPKFNLNEDAELRIIAGEYNNTTGPASTFTTINMYDLASKSGSNISLELKDRTNTILLVMSGNLELENKAYDEKTVLIFEQDNELIDFKASSNFKALVLNGEPIGEPVVAHGPFVMNTREEISEAIRDYQSGKMGKL